MAARKRGRPVQMEPAEREVLVLDCAMRLFSEQGPDAVTMADIARCAGMSKRTLYELYGNREELIGVVLSRMVASFFRPLHPDENAAPLTERLRILLTFNSGAGSVPLEMLRVVIAGARRFPETGRSLARMFPGKVAEQIGVELDRAVEAGEIRLAAGSIPAAAALLVDMVVGNAIACLLDPDHMPACPEDQAVRRDWAIRIFLDGVRPR